MNKKEIIDQIRATLAECNDLLSKASGIYEEVSIKKSHAIRCILQLIHPDVVTSADAMIGKVATGIDHVGRFFSISCETIQFRQAELALFGRGVRYVPGGAHAISEICIPYTELSALDLKFDFTKDDLRKNVAEYIEKAHLAEAASAKERIDRKFFEMADSIDAFLQGGVPLQKQTDAPGDTGTSGLEHDIYDITGFNWQEIYMAAPDESNRPAE